MEFTKKKAKVNLSPFRVDPDLKGQVSAVSLQTNKSYSEVMTYLVELGIAAHLNGNVEKQKEEKPKKKAAKKFVAPTVNEVFTHMFAINGDSKIAQDEAEKFHNYWSDMDWKRKGTKMKDWKGSASNWLKNNYGSSAAASKPDRLATPDRTELFDEMGVGEAPFYNPLTIEG